MRQYLLFSLHDQTRLDIWKAHGALSMDALPQVKTSPLRSPFPDTYMISVWEDELETGVTYGYIWHAPSVSD